MIKAESFIEGAKARGFALWTGVPCSYLKPFINYVIDAPDLAYIGAANEGEEKADAQGDGPADDGEDPGGDTDGRGHL